MPETENFISVCSMGLLSTCREDADPKLPVGVAARMYVSAPGPKVSVVTWAGVVAITVSDGGEGLPDVSYAVTE